MEEDMRRWLEENPKDYDAAPLVAMQFNNVLTNDFCAFCGGQCDPVGFDPMRKFMLSGRVVYVHLVCNRCAAEHGIDVRFLNADYREMRANEVPPLDADDPPPF
jgi:hypothetical protein